MAAFHQMVQAIQAEESQLQHTVLFQSESEGHQYQESPSDCGKAQEAQTPFL
jgi:hypothetical protein